MPAPAVSRVKNPACPGRPSRRDVAFCAQRGPLGRPHVGRMLSRVRFWHALRRRVPSKSGHPAPAEPSDRDWLDEAAAGSHPALDAATSSGPTCPGCEVALKPTIVRAVEYWTCGCDAARGAFNLP